MADEVRNKTRPDRDVDPATVRRRNELFDKYITPYYNMIYKLTMEYSWNSDHVEENYNEVLVNLYRGIETYDPNRSIRTWIHIVTKRHVIELEKKRARGNNKDQDKDIENYEEIVAAPDKPGAGLMGVENYREFYSDEILEVLDSMKSIHRDALILQEAGYSLKEIADIEYEKGTLKSHNIETVKSRLFLARQYMKKYLTRDGKRKND